MKTIEPVSIWDNGTVQEAKILNAYAINVTLSTSATFYYQLFAESIDLAVGPQLAQGNLTMTGDAYTQWEVDSYAWDWVAQQLNLTITGDYIPPVPTTTSTTTIAVPIHSTSTTTTTVVAE
jgi:hypothetical protein